MMQIFFFTKYKQKINHILQLLQFIAIQNIGVSLVKLGDAVEVDLVTTAVSTDA